MAFAWYLYHEVDPARPKVWFLASLLGITASANTVLVSHYDMYDHINPHILTAMLAFGGGVAWAFAAGWAMGDMATTTETYAACRLCHGCDRLRRDAGGLSVRRQHH